MGQPTGQRPAGEGVQPGPGSDDYRTPLLPGDYPPLGYSADGLPRYRPADLTARRVASPPVGHSPTTGGIEGPWAGPPEQAGGTLAQRPPTRGSSVERGVGVTVLAFVLVGIVIVGLVFFGMRSLREQTPTVSLPPVQNTETFTIPTVPADPSAPGTEQQRPRGGSTPQGAEVTYTVNIDGVGTILYVDDVGVRTEFSPPPAWTVTFTASRNPLRLLVVAGDGSSARCTITVGGRVVATDNVDATSSRRTASCLA